MTDDELDEMGEALERECFTPEMRAEAERSQAQREAIRHERMLREMREEDEREARWTPPQPGRFMPPRGGFEGDGTGERTWD